ncbi:hypothetical protein [Sutcliffiella rhizosphaerae]|uniref:Bacterial EndoU nuclease domain-containing protein n=1 Tax=Sutcliffiella rhizosphaerae TaxID=2880967 RepID=A0ABN8ABA1_9BACI|nr:hypothetical protein [Sutcliffiella rhizosphaerae]CAG9622485.1 hypothetical protein BACCIP111883_03276 [Sutcliffiella rhizosphaerae]
MRIIPNRFFPIFAVLLALLLFIPNTGQVQASTYSWNIYSNNIQYKATAATFYNKSCGQVNNATQGYFRLPNTYASTNIAKYEVGNGKFVDLDFGSCSTYGMTHILARHAPEHFIGNPTTVQSFFNPGHNLGYYESIIAQIVHNNRTQILNNGFTSNGTVVYGNTAHGQVRLVVKGGKVITMYPNGWGLGERM